jgi:hypothetical protein
MTKDSKHQKRVEEAGFVELVVECLLQLRDSALVSERACGTLAHLFWRCPAAQKEALKRGMYLCTHKHKHVHRMQTNTHTHKHTHTHTHTQGRRSCCWICFKSTRNVRVPLCWYLDTYKELILDESKDYVTPLLQVHVRHTHALIHTHTHTHRCKYCIA